MNRLAERLPNRVFGGGRLVDWRRIVRVCGHGAMCFASMMACSLAAAAADGPLIGEVIGQASCGSSRFVVTVAGGDHPLANVYRIYGQTGLTTPHSRLLYVANDGGWLDAACVQSKQGPSVLFQAHCGGTACVEARYGLISAQALTLLLQPPSTNASNAKEVQAMLGRRPPALTEPGVSFCCDHAAKR
jgi:hypothetical protein